MTESFRWTVLVCASVALFAVACDDDPPGDVDAGTPTDGSAPSDGGGGPVSACGDVPYEGRCLSDSQLEYCLVPTDEGDPEVETVDCTSEERCDESGGEAECVLDADCYTGDRGCFDADTLEVCEAGGWVDTPCPNGCEDSGYEAHCRPSAMFPTYNATVTYEHVDPNSGYTDWGTPEARPADGLLVLVFAGGEVVSSDVTETDGSFSVQVPPSPAPDDGLVILTAGVAHTGDLGFVVADPGYTSPGERMAGSDPPDAAVWQWDLAIDTLVDGETIPITVDDGAGAVQVYETAQTVYDLADGFYRPEDPRTLVIWVGIGTTWSCGACFAPERGTFFGQRFISQAWLDGGSDLGFRSDAVTAHELGHYVMDQYGKSPDEGGSHTLGVPTHPGQAWSEGFATYLSSEVRGSEIYYDKQGGLFSVDIGARRYSSGVTWQRPTPDGGLMQLMDENEVSALMWEISGAIGPDPILRAFGSTRMTRAPFAREYRTREWPDGMPMSYTSTSSSAPFLPDMLDALLCDGAISAADLDSIVMPAARYPYPSSTPLCSSPRSPITIEWRVVDDRASGLVLEAVIDRALPWLPIELALRVPAGASLADGSPTDQLPAANVPGRSTRTFELAFDRVPQEDLVLVADAAGDGFTYHAEIPYRFGRPEPQPTAPGRSSRRTRVGAADWGRPVRLRR